MRRALPFALFALLSSALTFFIGAQIANFDPGADRYGLSATFDDATNLRAGDAVRLAGVPVGQVTSVKPLDGRARVGFEVDKTVALADDSEVAVRWLNLIGQRELYLYPGKGATKLANGSTVKKTRSVVDIGALINQLGPLTASVSPGQLNSIIVALTTALDGNRSQLDGLVRNLNLTLETVGSRAATISQLLDDYATLSDVVAKRDLQIRQLVDDLASLTGAFAQSDEVLRTALIELPQLAVALRTLLGSDGAELGRIIDNLAVVTHTVAGQLTDLDTALTHFPTALAGVFRAASHGQFIVTNATCIAITRPPCPHPIMLQAGTSGSGSLSSPPAFASQLLAVDP